MTVEIWVRCDDCGAREQVEGHWSEPYKSPRGWAREYVRRQGRYRMPSDPSRKLIGSWHVVVDHCPTCARETG